MGPRKRAAATVGTLIAAFLLPMAAQAPAQAAANAWTPGISPLHSGEYVERDIPGGADADRALKICALASGIACVSVGQGDGKQSIFHLYRCGTRSLSNFVDALSVLNNQTGGAEVRFTGPKVGTYKAPADPNVIWNFPNEATFDFNTMSIC
ncbi:hypothetical protein IAG44_23545 [Streptomyces roseirectus]|uniref:Secreted protein n=1 Tax=Streptomyces roseirectus TaxID=2768066 RepID=A0A7H0IH28_9ACTN|nr:hypothetical protein [Streptomyces roseirectus]QNP72094.1 hypothetical protein IAG44_23545 [Streptomyces roseirectus]